MRKYCSIALILIISIGSASFLKKKDSYELRDGAYKFPTVARVIMYFQVEGKRIAFYRSHAGHYASFGRYKINTEDSTIMIQYHKTIASTQFMDIRPLITDTVGYTINKNGDIELFGLKYVEPESNQFYKDLSKRIKKDSKRIK